MEDLSADYDKRQQSKTHGNIPVQPNITPKQSDSSSFVPKSIPFVIGGYHEIPENSGDPKDALTDVGKTTNAAEKKKLFLKIFFDKEKLEKDETQTYTILTGEVIHVYSKCLVVGLVKQSTTKPGMKKLAGSYVCLLSVESGKVHSWRLHSLVEYSNNQPPSKADCDKLFDFSLEKFADSVVVQNYKKDTKSVGFSDQVFELKCTLRGSEPAIYRKLEVEGFTTLESLHQVLNIAMGWADKFAYQFSVNGEDLEAANEQADESPSKIALCDLLFNEGDFFLYEYDLDDSWVHVITVEKLKEPKEDVVYPICTEGARACPPEKCGGVERYQDFFLPETRAKNSALLTWARESAGPANEAAITADGELGWDPARFSDFVVNNLLLFRKRKFQ